jgi:hypothetical protein
MHPRAEPGLISEVNQRDQNGYSADELPDGTQRGDIHDLGLPVKRRGLTHLHRSSPLPLLANLREKSLVEKAHRAEMLAS